MPDDQNDLVLATPNDVQQALAGCLLGKHHIKRPDDLIAQILAEHLFEHLKRSGYVVLRSRDCGSGPNLEVVA